MSGCGVNVCFFLGNFGHDLILQILWVTCHEYSESCELRQCVYENSHTYFEKSEQHKMDCFFCCFSFGFTLSLWFSVRVCSTALSVCVLVWCGTLVKEFGLKNPCCGRWWLEVDLLAWLVQSKSPKGISGFKSPGVISLSFMQFLDKILPIMGFCPPLGMPPPPSGKSWIRQ